MGAKSWIDGYKMRREQSARNMDKECPCAVEVRKQGEESVGGLGKVPSGQFQVCFLKHCLGGQRLLENWQADAAQALRVCEERHGESAKNWSGVLLNIFLLSRFPR